MKILVVGAGAIGGYFGGRLIEKGEDVTFLVREKRKNQLENNGLVIESVHGDLQLKPRTLVSGDFSSDFDVILLSTKAYQLQSAIEDIRPYVSDHTLILPLLNGISHIEELMGNFGEEKILGGLCFIESTLDDQGKIIQTSPSHDFVFGERSGENTERILALQETFAGTIADFRLSENIEQEMWHKYLFITTLSGVTSLFRSSIGPIRDQEYGRKKTHSLLQEVSSIMRRIQAPLADNSEEIQLNKLMQLSYQMKSSLQRDMEKGVPTEAEHFFGYLIQLASKTDLATPILEAIYANLKIYESVILKPLN
ncbi:MAG: 2-dehydropantoate 2-reductase [Neobacillus sp.]|nr:2-dehydropantoate 2-reductase [Neobacillus sp.]